jgi:uncharacterized membrane protein
MLVSAYRLAAVIAIAASSILAVEYEAAAPGTFCGTDGGCAAVRASELARFFSNLGLDLPRLGVFGFVGLLTASLFAASRMHHQVIAAVTSVAGLLAALFLAAQLFVIGAICPFCVVVDSAAIVASVASVWLALRAPERASNANSVPLLAWSFAAIVASSAPFVWHAMPVAPELPPAVAERAIPGKTTLVVFTDFECPFCRKMHEALDEAVSAGAGQVALVRVMAPIDSHQGALPAAKAYVCAPEASREPLAHALYGAAPEALRGDGVFAFAASVGLSDPAFRACFEAPATTEKVAAEKAAFKSLGARGIPLTYVGGTALIGYDPEALADAIRLQGASNVGLPVGAMYALLCAVLALALWVSRRDDPFRSPSPNESSP